MKPLNSSLILTFAAFSLSVAAPALAQTPLPLPGANLEEDTDVWRIKEKVPMTQISPDAAREGEKGLRVEDNDAAEGSSAVSARVNVHPGKRYRITFWGRTSTPGAVGVYAWFYKKAGGAFIGQNPPATATINKKGDGWTEYSFEAEAPEEAGYMALWVHSLGQGTGSADLDDFTIEEI